MSAIELISLLGFSFFLGWIFVTVFWLFCFFPPEASVAERDLCQLAAFVGLPAGLLVLHFLGKRAEFTPFKLPLIVGEFACTLALPVAAFAMFYGVALPYAVTCVASFLAGLGSAGCLVSYLDVLSRLQTDSYRRFTGLGFTVAIILFALASTAPAAMLPVFSFAYIAFSIPLMFYTSKNADANDLRAPVHATGDPWKFAKEIEPAFFAFSVVFAFNFVYLFNTGAINVQVGLLSTAVGSIAVALLSIVQRSASITTLQRVLLVITVLGCVAMPFADGALQVACACLVVAAWGMFKCVNYAFIVKKSVTVRDVPFFRQAPVRLVVSPLGFALGWAIASITTFLCAPHAAVFSAERLIMAVLLVVVVMVFFPTERHHPMDGAAAIEGNAAQTVVSVQLDESELFNRKCEAVVRLYQLSPREADILSYLAKGRNAAWIQEELMVSPHTVKSHIYNIYKKLDIHSQQKLMDFVQDFPLDADDVK